MSKQGSRTTLKNILSRGGVLALGLGLVAIGCEELPERKSAAVLPPGGANGGLSPVSIGQNAKPTTMEVLATASGLPTDMIVTADHVYWTNLVSGAISRLERASGTVVTLGYGANPVGLALSGGELFWANRGTATASGMLADASGSIARQSLENGATTLLVTGQRLPSSIAVDATHVYWTTEGTRVNGRLVASTGTLARVPLAGGSIQVLADKLDLPGHVALDEKNVYWSNSGATAPTGTVMRIAKAGGMPTAIADAAIHPGDIAIGPRHVYWTEANAIYRRSLTGTEPAEAVVQNLESPASLALDETHIYWATSTTVQFARLDEGTVTTLASNQPGAITVFLFGDSVFWATLGTPGTNDLSMGAILSQKKS